MADDVGFEDEGTLVLEQRFAIVPEWITDAPISDCAFHAFQHEGRPGPAVPPHQEAHCKHGGIRQRHD